MKKSIIAMLCATQLLNVTVAHAYIGDANDIARYSQYKNLAIAGNTFETYRERRLYSLRNNASIWFVNGRSTGKLETYLRFVQNSPNVGNENQLIWGPLASSYYQTANQSTWVTLEMVATHSLLLFLDNNGIYDYADLNQAINGSLSDFVFYLNNLRSVRGAGKNTKPIATTNNTSGQNQQNSTPQKVTPTPSSTSTTNTSTSTTTGQQPKPPVVTTAPVPVQKPDAPINSDAKQNPINLTPTVVQNTTPPIVLTPVVAPTPVVNQPTVNTPNTPVTNTTVVAQPTVPATPVVQADAIGLSNSHYANDPSLQDVDQFKKLYGSNIWTDANGVPNSLAARMKDYLRANAASNGLIANDYWSGQVEELYQAALAGQANQFESVLTGAFLRYVNHLANGRLDPQSVDANLFKFKMQKVSDLKSLASLLRLFDGGVTTAFDSYVPNLPQYKNLVNSLARLRDLKARGLYKKIAQPKKDLKLGESSATVASLRAQLALLGYSDTGSSPVYDSSFDALITSYLAKNGMPGKIDYRFWNSLGKSVDERIQQVMINMEKLRWLGRQGQDRFAFVNLAAQEIQLMDQGQKVMSFRTVNGRTDRPTPSMVQQIRRLILNPTWTVPPGLAIKDKIPLIKKDPDFLLKHNMYVLDVRSGQYVFDTYSMDWSLFKDDKSTPYYFVQGPGNQNALGVLKFPLQNLDGSPNADDIYMHDTNERELFSESIRYRSSGCIRLQMPLEFATELMKGKMTMDDIKAKVPWDNPDQYVDFKDTNQSVTLPKSLLVYIMYLTADQADDGALRSLEDAYGLDAKIKAQLVAQQSQ